VCNMQRIQCPCFQFHAKSIDQLSAFFRNRLPFEWLALPCAARDERLQPRPVFRVGFAGSEGKRSLTFQFRELAEHEWQRILPDELFCKFGLSADIEMQGCGEVGIQIIHRFSCLRKSSTGLVSLTGCFFSHSKWLFQSNATVRFGLPTVSVRG